MWYIPRNYKIIEHSHPKENVELLYVFGSCKFFRRNVVTGDIDTMVTGIRTFLKKFSVKSYHSHWFSVSGLPLVFINIATFPEGKAVSASQDFKEYGN